MTTTLRGRNRWAVLGLAVWYTVLILCFGHDDASLYVFAVLAWTAAALALRMRVEVTARELRHVGFWRTRVLDAAEVSAIEPALRWGAAAPLLHVDGRRPFFLYALSSGSTLAEEQTTVLHRRLRRPHPR
ncbi:hypothetical protein AB2L28_07570 [Kineococcus sp. TBRC 1896]|uniref:PH domain-containing protein n=1 Tax=Kineococcus mangrovi TaxID=1660183 RepID=A0ABV4I090_9ACTN